MSEDQKKFWGEVCWLLNLTTHATEDDIKAAIRTKDAQLEKARKTLRAVINEHCSMCRHGTADYLESTPGCDHPEFPKEQTDGVPQTPCGSWSKFVFWYRSVIEELKPKEYGCNSPCVIEGEVEGRGLKDAWYCPECEILSFNKGDTSGTSDGHCANCGVCKMQHALVVDVED